MIFSWWFIADGLVSTSGPTLCRGHSYFAMAEGGVKRLPFTLAGSSEPEISSLAASASITEKLTLFSPFQLPVPSLSTSSHAAFPPPLPFYMILIKMEKKIGKKPNSDPLWNLTKYGFFFSLNDVSFLL